MRKLFLLVLVLLVACATPPPAKQEPVWTAPVVTQPEPVVSAPSLEGGLCSRDADCPANTYCYTEGKTSGTCMAMDYSNPFPLKPEGETVEEFIEDKQECWKDSDCGQDCASNYIMNVYKCDIARHTCNPSKGVPLKTVQCEKEYGYGFRCRVGKCMKGS